MRFGDRVACTCRNLFRCGRLRMIAVVSTGPLPRERRYSGRNGGAYGHCDHRRAAERRHRQDDAGRQHRRRRSHPSRRVALLDIDPQKSLGRWHSLRQARPEQAAALAFSDISGWRLAAELDRLKRDHDVVVIDSPPQLDTDAPRRGARRRYRAGADTTEPAGCLGRGGHAESRRVTSGAPRIWCSTACRRRRGCATRSPPIWRRAPAPAALGPWQPRRLRACLRRRPRRHRGRATLHRRRGAACLACRIAGVDGMMTSGNGCWRCTCCAR